MADRTAWAHGLARTLAGPGVAVFAVLLLVTPTTRLVTHLQATKLSLLLGHTTTV